MSIPDVEALLVGHLNEQQTIISIAGVDRVSTEIPAGAEMPRIRLTLTGGSPEIPGWLHSPRVNIEAYADTKTEAFDLIVAAIEAAEQLSNTVRDGIVISSCEQETGLSWSPDPFTETPRYLAAIVLYVHPDPTPA